MPTLATVLVAVVATAVLPSRAAAAFTDLTAGKRLKAKDGADPRSDKLVVRFSGDPNLLTIPQSPLCPTQSVVRLVSDGGAYAEQVLDCSNWTIAGTGFRYYETPVGPGSLRKIIYRPGKLIVALKGVPYSDDPVGGPIGFLETRVAIGSTEYCGRWEQPPSALVRNQTDRIVAKGPTGSCQTECGNSVVEAPEECDDGNTASGDGCDGNCTATACGNGIQTSGEQCDDGNGSVGDGCRPDCTLETCGDGTHDPQEACDDANTAAGDCCAPDCTFESPGSPCADDGNVCTDDTCDGAGTCTHPANTAPCDDVDGCTTGDVCSGGECAGSLRQPWINEIDYDDFTGVLDDRDEFIEIAGPAGTDLSGYQIFSVEGGPSGTCLTPHVAPFAAIGEANMATVVPNGVVLGDDTGTGIGFLVVCFTFTSQNVVNIPACDVVLPGPRTDSNLFNGYLTNGDEVTCPDGVLLLDAGGGYVDSVSYEGVVPAVGTYGPYFHLAPPYSAPRDEGWLFGVSIEKTSSTLARAESAAEWRDPSEVGLCVGQQGTGCVSFTSTPGMPNPLQTLECGSASPAFLDEVATG